VKLLNYFLILMFFSCGLYSQDKPAYKLFDQNGKQVKYAKMMKELSNADMVFVGEQHTDPISHWFEYEVTKDLYLNKKQNLIIGAEMFESDNQVILDEYLGGFFEDKKFESDARLWKNYKTDYKPVVEFARDSGIYVVATNIPRRYASVVHKKGLEALDSLSAGAKQFIAPLPIKYDPDVACYKNILDMMKQEIMPAATGKAKEATMKHEMPDTTMTSDSTAQDTISAPVMKEENPMIGMNSHITENLPKAQAVKDATMAYFILKNWEKGKLFVHYNGAYHSENHEGIVWYIDQEKPGLNIKTIAVTNQDDIEKLEEENKNIADYIICVPSSMTQTSR